MSQNDRNWLLSLIALATTSSCSPTTRMGATAKWDASPQGVTVSIVVANRYAEPLTTPSNVVYIGLGRCVDGEGGLRVEGVADGGVSRTAAATTLKSRPFAETKQVGPGMCTQLFTASMMPFSRHYRTGLIQLS